MVGPWPSTSAGSGAMSNGTAAIILSHSRAKRPAASVTSRKSQVSWSTDHGSSDSAMGTRTTSLSGV